MRLREFFKTRSQFHTEEVVTFRVAMKMAKANFINQATENGFTKQQAEFMASYLSLACHVHEFHSELGDSLTRRPV